MIKFFRNFRQKLLSEGGTDKPSWPVFRYLKYAFGEIILVVIGILIALSINNWNEQKKEQKNAVILSKSMLADLVKDTAALHFVIEFNENKSRTIDSFIETIHSPQETWDVPEFYQGLSTTFTTFPFSPTNGTYEQMKSTGTFTYFNQELVNKMNEYSNQVRETIFRDELVEKAEWELVPLASSIVNFEVTGDLRFNRPITHQTYIKLNDEETKDIFINKILTVKIMMGRSLEEYYTQLKIAEELIGELNNRINYD